jgi:hypothetical protein
MERQTMMLRLLRLSVCLALAYFLLWPAAAPAQFVYRLCGPVYTPRAQFHYHCWQRHNFKNVAPNPYGAYPYGVMYSGFNHGPFPPVHGVIEGSVIAPAPEPLGQPREQK